MRSPCCFLALCLLALVCSGEETPPRNRAPSGTAAADLKAANDVARAAYRDARERALAACGPIVLWDGDNLIFRYGTYRRVSQPTPAFYHDLKTTGHMALGLAAMLGDQPDTELSAQQRFALKRYRESIAAVRQAVRHLPLSKLQRQRQEKILDACADHVNKVIDSGKAPVKDLRALLRGLRPLLDDNTADAARGQIDALHRDMQRYRAQLSDAEWKKLRVIVQGSQPPRKNNLAVQFFARLLDEPGEGGRIVYAEMIFDESKALALLAAWDLDARVAEDVWEDPGHLHRDLLGPAARAYLDRLFGKK
jgi:hypothetical protein